MAHLDDTTPATRFDSFHVYRTFYKIGDHEIEVGILVPKELKPGKHPLMVKFHGGGLVTGDCLYADWIGAFFVPLIHRTSSIVVLPNYRLTPEHTGADILADLSDFWAWFARGELTRYLQAKHAGLQLGTANVLVTGDSAGGYMALMSGLLLHQHEHQHQNANNIKAIFAQYPMTNYLRREPEAMLHGVPAPNKELVEHHVSRITPGTVLSSALPPARSDLSYALSAYGDYLKYFGQDAKLWPLGAIEDAKSMPSTWIVHGEADSIVLCQDSQDFVRKWTDREVKGEVKLSVVPGQEHGFDIGVKEDEEEWLKEGLKWVEEKWLA
ncbi:hypothetical protein ACEQ8H_006837 [Pleosporales sp. CAS-2024a]